MWVFALEQKHRALRAVRRVAVPGSINPCSVLSVAIDTDSSGDARRVVDAICARPPPPPTMWLASLRIAVVGERLVAFVCGPADRDGRSTGLSVRGRLTAMARRSSGIRLVMGAAGGLGERHGDLVGSFDAQAGAGGV